MESLLISIFRDQDPSLIANIFITTIIIVFLLSLTLYVKKTQSTFVYHTPTILTSLGILGTFVGIVIGLLDFDSAKIDESIPVLLEGLKVAFISSFVGMFFSIIFKVFYRHQIHLQHNSRELILMTCLLRLTISQVHLKKYMTLYIKMITPALLGS